MYYVYMIRCEDNSIYTGITTDLKRRMNEHFSKNEKCAKYTLKHTVKSLENAWETENRILASKLEYHIKKLNKKQKEEIIISPNKIKEFLEEKIDADNYKSIDKKSLKSILTQE